MAGILVQNSILKQAEAQIEKQLAPEVRQNYMKIVVAGMKLALNKGSQGLLATLKASKDPLNDIVKGAIGIVGFLRRESKGAMPVKAMVPAAFALVLQGLDMAEKVGVLEVTKEVLAEATQAFLEEITHVMGLTPESMQGLATKVQGVMGDPAKMNQLKQAGAQNGIA